MVYDIDGNLGDILSKIKRKKFCNNSCSASFNNKNRNVSEQTKNKLRITLKSKYKKKEKKRKVCIVCGVDFYVGVDKRGRYSRRNTCSDECHFILVSNKSKEVAKKLIESGKHKGWVSRKKKRPSYAESYFINLFNKENISGWDREYKIGKYFIDFAFLKQKIALEIDGKQHWMIPERIESDNKKDAFLKNEGWLVIRIKWYNPINEKNKQKLYEQINEFKNIYNSVNVV